MDIVQYNREAWNHLVAIKNRWTIPVSKEEIDRARAGDFVVVLTPCKPVPQEWFPPLNGLKILCLASGGGQQAPLLAAAGGEVTVFDNSPSQLAQDRKVAEENALNLKTIQGDMADLSELESNSFDLIFHPCSNCFAPSLIPVWNECARVLKKGGLLLWGFTKAESYLVTKDVNSENYLLKYKMPYSDINSLDEKERNKFIENKEPLIFGHSLEEQIGDLLKNNFVLTDLFEDDWGGTEWLDAFFKSFVGARAIKK
jgi:ubiquinone/menaquinone biosynthesis C-methylase UbiE